MKEEKKKSEGESFIPRVTRRKLERERPALATQVYYAIAQGCMRVPTYTENNFV